MMAYIPKNQGSNGQIRAVQLGVGKDAMCIGGQSVLPFYTFDGEMPNKPKLGLEISDLAEKWTLPGLAALYTGCRTMQERAARAAAVPGVDFLCLHFEGADPSAQDRSVDQCAQDALAVAQAVTLPLVILGCKDQKKEQQLLDEISRLLAGKNILCMGVRQESCGMLSACAAPERGHKLGARSADNINLAKQLNIMLTREQGVGADSIVMDLGTAAVGYGFEYASSTFERVRLAAIEQGDADLQMPIIAPVSPEVYGVKEATVTEDEEPAWGDREKRAVSMEVATAAALLTVGADAVVLRHPDAVAALGQFIDSLAV